MNTAAEPLPPPHPRRALRRLIRPIFLWTASVSVLVIGLFFGWAWFTVRGSRPVTNGTIAVAGLTHPVTVARDARGVPWIRGSSRVDVARALGFIHAQERFFQMDLLRRQAAGELAALLGDHAVEWDRRARVHRFRSRAEAAVAAVPPGDRRLIDAYTAGVNVGLTSLGAAPFEYLLLRIEPEPWRPEDTMLALLSMFFALHDTDNRMESDLAVMADTLPPALLPFLAPPGTTWDAPLQGDCTPVPDLPSADILDLRRRPPATQQASGRAGPLDACFGSNNWAVAGRRTSHGGALLANDMHLGLHLPNTWYQVAMSWPADDGERQVVGVTLPGTPALVVGTNRRVAWGFTNSYGDWLDWVIVHPEPDDPGRYLTPAGPRAYEKVVERIDVRGGPPVDMEVVSTIWGPVVGRDHRGRPRVLRWTAHEPDGINLRLMDLENAQNIDQVIEWAARCGIPPQNVVCVDTAGRIGWTICGRIPRRVGFDGRRPVSWADGACRWDGWLPAAEYPRLVDPPSGIIWTANNRVTTGGDLLRVGDSGYDLGARARQIRDNLAAVSAPDEGAMLRLQLDDRALFLARWRDQVLAQLTPEAVTGHPGRAEFRRLVQHNWDGHASTDSSGYRLVRAYRLTLLEEVYGWFITSCRAADPDFGESGRKQWEDALWRLVTEQPPHLLDSRYRDWPAVCLAAVDRVVAELTAADRPLTACTWGDRNNVKVRHRLSGAIPLLAEWADMTPRPLPGDAHMPRFQSPGAGASERMVVSPGREERAIFHMPGGPSGHPQSPYYGAGHADWEEGRPTPLLPGPARWILTLTPAVAQPD